MLDGVIDGVIDGYDGLSQAVSLSIYRLLRYAGEGAVSVFFFPEGAPHPHRAFYLFNTLILTNESITTYWMHG